MDTRTTRTTTTSRTMVQSFVSLMSLMSLMSLCLFLLFTSVLNANPPIIKEIQAHLILNDPQEACRVAKKAIKAFPDNRQIWENYIIALSKQGNEQELTEAWNHYASHFPDPYKDSTLLENMAWGIISNASRSSSPIIRIIALIGAFFGQDAQGVAILKKALKDQNTIVRAAAVQISGRLRDAELIETILSMLREEKNWRVRLEVIKASGQMKIVEAKPILMKILADNHSLAEEKASSILALVSLMETLHSNEIAQLAASNRLGLRQLACKAIGHFNLTDQTKHLAVLSEDRSEEVRICALQAIGILQIDEIEGESIESFAEKIIQHPNAELAITASWLLTLHNPSKGLESLKSWLNHKNQDIRIFAVSALNATGKFGVPLMREALESDDLFIRANAAMSLIGQRETTEKACHTLFQCFMTDSSLWDWRDQGHFRALAPSKLRCDEALISTPESVSQLAHLEVLNAIAIMKYPEAQQAIAKFLNKKHWGISGSASAMLLTECDEGAAALVTEMLTDPHRNIRVQAALILSLWGGDEQSLQVMHEAYATADRELKEKILEGLGNVGNRKSIPFLVEKLSESYQTLRVIAASALLQTLYH